MRVSLMSMKLKRSLARLISGITARSIEVKVAETDDEFEQIFKLNYATFVDEVQQHKENPEKKLIDKNHGRNTYLVAKKNHEVVGMVCFSAKSEEGFSIEKKMTHFSNLLPYLNNAVEIRLLAIKPAYRGVGVLWKIGKGMEDWVASSPYENFLISAVRNRLGLYESIGFKAIDRAASSGQNFFVPMVLTKQHFYANRSSYKF